MTRRFGTDGVRGTANVDLSAQDALSVSAAAAVILGENGFSAGRRPTAIIGQDPRPSGHMLTAAVTAGLTSAGVDVIHAGMIPTPAVAYLVKEWELDFGVMVSASHNPMPDNGIKFFGSGGHKLDDQVEESIEQVWLQRGGAAPSFTGTAVGRMSFRPDAALTYMQHLLSIFGVDQNSSSLAYLNPAIRRVKVDKSQSHDGPLKGLKIVVDAANGASAHIAPMIFTAAGAEVIAINTDTSGDHINENCGSTHLEPLQRSVLKNGAHAGIALDGDADRCIAVDEKGNVLDGDSIMAILAIALAKHRKLKKNMVVATVMSNYGLHQVLAEQGIGITTTAVGDRYVLEEIRANGYTLGGEQSGHIIVSDHATTGDGILTGLLLLSHVASDLISHDYEHGWLPVLAKEKAPLSALSSNLVRLPQIIINVPVRDKTKISTAPKVTEAMIHATTLLEGRGRIILRPSGTEQLFRVMVESTDSQEAKEIAENIANIIGSQ